MANSQHIGIRLDSNFLDWLRRYDGDHTNISGQIKEDLATLRELVEIAAHEVKKRFSNIEILAIREAMTIAGYQPYFVRSPDYLEAALKDQLRANPALTGLEYIIPKIAALTGLECYALIHLAKIIPD